MRNQARDGNVICNKHGTSVPLVVLYVLPMNPCNHFSDVVISATTSQITGVSVVYSAVCSGTDQRKHQSSASLAFGRGIRRWPVSSPHKGSRTRKMFPFDVIMTCSYRLVVCNRFSFVSVTGTEYSKSIAQGNTVIRVRA